MEKRKEGLPGEARAVLRRSVRENGCVQYYGVLVPTYSYSSLAIRLKVDAIKKNYMNQGQIMHFRITKLF